MRHLTIIAALSLSACATQPEPLCDREAVEWDKHGTAEVPQSCLPPVIAAPLMQINDRDGTRVTISTTDDPHDPMMPPTSKPPSHKPPTTEPPKHEPPSSHPPAKRQKGNNGWGNGSQDAPGKSEPKNNAENGPKGKNDGRGKNSGNSGKGKRK